MSLRAFCRSFWGKKWDWKVAQSGRSNGEVNSHAPHQVQLTHPVHRHACLHSIETAAWEGRSQSEAPLTREFAGGGSKNGSGLVPNDM